MRKLILYGVMTLFISVSLLGKPVDFENGKLNGWKANQGKVEITGKRFKSGTHSLLWQWNSKNASLKFSTTPFKVMKNRKGNSCFGLWIYNEKPQNKQLYVEILHKNKVLKKVWYNLNFKGWRPVGADYIKIGIKKGSQIDGLKLLSPDAKGKLYLDFVDAGFRGKGPNADYIQPWANDVSILNTPQKHIYSSKDWSKNRPYLPKLSSLSKEQKGDMKKLCEYVLTHSTYGSAMKYSSVDRLKKEFASYGIKKENGIITGKPIQCGRQAYMPVPGAIDFNKKFILTMRKLYTAYEKESSPKVKAEIVDMYNDLCAHFLDQGWQEGNNNMGWPGNGYDIRYWPNSVVKMRGVLKKSGLLDEMAKSVNWVMMGNQVVKTNPKSSVDQFYNYSPHYLATATLTLVPAERFQRLMAFKLYLDRIFAGQKPFGADGSVHHHGGNHLAYGGYSPPVMLRTQIKPLEGTVFQISPKSYKRLKTYTRAVAFQSSAGMILPNLYMRAGTPIKLSPASSAVYLIELNDGKNIIDREMAGIYLQYNKNSKEAEKFKKASVKPIIPQGHHTLNMGAAGIHRRDDWLVAAVGMGKSFRGLEIYGWLESNNYGRYARNGSVWPTKNGKSGYRFDGWNWSFWPGATSVVRQQQELFEGYTMFNSGTWFAGGTNLNANGIWGMDFKGLDVTFKKSAFCFGKTITVITTDIEKDNIKSGNSPGQEVVTTLFQQELKKKDIPEFVNGKKVTAFPFKETVTLNKAVTLKDTLGNGYYIWPGKSKVKILRRQQQWTYLFKRYLKDKANNPCVNIRKKKYKEKPLTANEKYYNPTEGDFALAYFDHGKDPDYAKCVYTLLPYAEDEALNKFSKAMSSNNPPVKIIQMDKNAHVVYDVTSKTYGYVIFNANSKLPGPISKVNRPCFMMINGTKLSLAESDKRNKEKSFKVQLKSGRKLKIKNMYPLPAVVDIK